MSSYRIGGGLAALVLAVLLILVTVQWLGYSGLVRPSVAVKPEGPGATTPRPPTSQSGTTTQSAAIDVLAARTRLQAGDVNRRVSPEQDKSLTFQPGVPDSASLARSWQQASAPAGSLTPPQDTFGLSSLPYRNADVLQQPQGRDWRNWRNGPLRFGGGWLIFGVSLALALFLLGRGRVRIAEGRSGESIPRFNALERANHWMTAVSFIVMGLTGLVILYGKPILLPVVGEAGLGEIAWWSAWLHMGSAVPFVLGVALMIILWLRENLITRLDLVWLRELGGFLNDDPHKPSANRFNAGQKLVFWGVVLGGLAALITGIVLMFPFRWLGYDGMQWTQLIHALIGLLMIALIIGHIYIGTVGMEGAVEAMWSGRVDRNWAKEHHDLWYRRIAGNRRGESSPPAMPAE
ncbi:MAG: formate dehydrogenase subunit gamma [Hyphomicrobiales bacterium]|nr:formate dehydrogenase subunit gamma [Hyphomicrobiales bacterium]